MKDELRQDKVIKKGHTGYNMINDVTQCVTRTVKIFYDNIKE